MLGQLALTLCLADETNAFCQLLGSLRCLGNVRNEGKSKLILEKHCQRPSHPQVNEAAAHDISQPFEKTSPVLCHDFTVSHSGRRLCYICPPLNLPTDINAMNKRRCDQAHSVRDILRPIGGS
jgi:hypothetical protein